MKEQFKSLSLNRMNLYDELFEEQIDPKLGKSRISSVFSFMDSKVFPLFILSIVGFFFYKSLVDESFFDVRLIGFILLYVLTAMVFRSRRMYDDVYIDFKHQRFVAKGNLWNRKIEKSFTELVKVKRPIFYNPYKLKFRDGTTIVFQKKWDTLEQLRVVEMIIKRNNSTSPNNA